MIRKLPTSILMNQAVYFAFLMIWLFSLELAGFPAVEASSAEYIFWGFWMVYPILVVVSATGLAISLKRGRNSALMLWNAVPWIWIGFAILGFVYNMMTEPAHYE